MRNTLTLLTALLVPAMGWAQSRNSPEGVWQVTEIRRTGPNARTTSPAQLGLLIFTDGYYSLTAVTSDGPRVEPDGFPATASADELRAVWGPFVATAGVYEVEAWTLTVREQVAKNPSEMGGDNPRGQVDEFTTFAFALTPDRDTLTMRTHGRLVRGLRRFRDGRQLNGRNSPLSIRHDPYRGAMAGTSNAVRRISTLRIATSEESQACAC